MRSALIFLTLIGLGVLGRLLPHLPNATPLTALARSARDVLGPRAAYTVPLLALFVSDLAIGFYDWRLMLSVYGSFAFIALLTRLVPATRPHLLSVLAPLTFFLTTNAAVWALSPWYAKTAAGLFAAYTAGLPFLGYMLLGDVFFLTSLALVQRYRPFNKWKWDLRIAVEPAEHLSHVPLR